MIAQLRGRLIQSSVGRWVLAVGQEGSWLGMEVHVPKSDPYTAASHGEVMTLLTHLHVREDAMDLYGFLTSSELQIFHSLLSVSGIGPKGALGILSGAEPFRIVQGLISKDKEFLVGISGVGKKTAERLILELSDKLAKQYEGQSMAGGASSGRQVILEARSALLGLGFKDSEVEKMLQKAQIGPDTRSEDVVVAALKHSGALR